MWFEDIETGNRAVIGSYTFTEENIIAFARAYDPQPFHVDHEAAKQSLFGGLVASGWHTVAVWMKLMIAYRRARDGGTIGSGVRAGVSPGFRDLKWLKPVRPGMTLTYSSETIGKITLASRPEWGIVESLNEAHDEKGQLVMSFVGKGFVPRKPQKQ